MTQARNRRARSLVDEDRLVLRYSRDHWSLNRCQEVFGLNSPGAVKTILSNHGIPIRGTAELDENAVLRCFDRLGGVQAAATALGTNFNRIAAILDKHEIPHSSVPRVSIHPDGFWTRKEVATLLRVSTAMIGQMLKRGDFPHASRAGRQIRIPGCDVQARLKGQTCERAQALHLRRPRQRGDETGSPPRTRERQEEANGESQGSAAG